MRTRNLSGRTTGRARLTKEGPGDRSVHFTLVSVAARLRWMHGNARHNTEAAEWKTTGRRPAGLSRVKAEPGRHPFAPVSPAPSLTPAKKPKREGFPLPFSHPLSFIACRIPVI
ncbi:hypothetical protein ONZ27_002758 [Salmonella enterica subsp. enterica serovar Chandans]|nr:hypothetical protein [Salmonella enterica]EKB3330341.1 hypothetical protein [Salmonella enterica subsp. enterica serovar Chandans]